MTDISVGDRIEVVCKLRVLYRGTVLAKTNANDDMSWGHKMRPEWHYTLDLDGLGARNLRDDFFTAKTMRNVGSVWLRPEPEVVATVEPK